MSNGIETGSFNRLTWTPGGTIGQHTVANGVQTFLNTAYSARMRTAFEYNGVQIYNCAVYIEDVRVTGSPADVSFNDSSPTRAWAKVTIPKKHGRYDLSNTDKLKLEVLQQDEAEPEDNDEYKTLWFLLYEKNGNVVIDWRHTHTICACNTESSSEDSSESGDTVCAITDIRFEWKCPTLMCYVSKVPVYSAPNTGSDDSSDAIEVFTATPHSAEHVM